MFERVRNAALAAIRAQDELLDAWRAFSSEEVPLTESDADVRLLDQLIFRKIDPLNAFSALVRLNCDAGIDSLLRRYLGSGVSPDKGFGGFQFDMSSMLSDLVEAGGEEALRRLLTHPDFNRAMLADVRFIESVCEALDMNVSGFPEWLPSLKGVQENCRPVVENTTTATPGLLTAEEYLQLPDSDRPSELIRGCVVEYSFSTTRHGVICANIAWELNNCVKLRDVGRVIVNTPAVVTHRDPDTIRGPDICYYSYACLPRGPVPQGVSEVIPELALEVRSPNRFWDYIYIKVGELLGAGVVAVCVLDERTKTLTIFRRTELQRVLTMDDEFTIPDIFGDELRIPVSRFFAE